MSFVSSRVPCKRAKAFVSIPAILLQGDLIGPLLVSCSPPRLNSFRLCEISASESQISKLDTVQVREVLLKIVLFSALDMASVACVEHALFY